MEICYKCKNVIKENHWHEWNQWDGYFHHNCEYPDLPLRSEVEETNQTCLLCSNPVFVKEDGFAGHKPFVAKYCINHIYKRFVDAGIVEEKYWQHDETGRVCAIAIRPSERWTEITKEQYEQHG